MRLQQGRRNVFTIGQAKLDPNHTPFCLLLSFCTTEYLVSITINKMRGRTIILHLLISLFYLLLLLKIKAKPAQSYILLSIIISLISPKSHIIALIYYLPFAKMEFCFYLEKTAPAKTGAAGPISLALYRHFVLAVGINYALHIVSGPS